MTPETKLTCGIILLSVPTIQYGGYFLLTVLTGKQKLALTDFQKSMFRAGHAHAGVLVILSLIAEIFTEYAGLGRGTEIFVRTGFPLSAILVSAGFFASAAGRDMVRPNSMIAILYAGVLLLALNLIVLGIGLITSK
jgi:Ni,Fe-hydrogenase I cytochrome b subunit